MSVGVISWRTDVFDAYTMTETAVRAELVCDTVADLPAPTFVAGSRLIIGSTAHVIADGGSDYMMNSAGSWILARSADLALIIAEINQIESDLQDAAADATYAKTQIDDLIKPALVSLVNQGAKNRLRITASDTQTTGIQFTINQNGSVTADGVNTDKKATGNIFFSLGTMEIKASDVIHLSGCPAGGSYSNAYSFYIDYQGGSTLAYDEGSGTTYTATADRTLRCRISIRSGTVIDNLTFWPMICENDFYQVSHDYRIYTPTNRELYDLIRSYHP